MIIYFHTPDGIIKADTTRGMEQFDFPTIEKLRIDAEKWENFAKQYNLPLDERLKNIEDRLSALE